MPGIKKKYSKGMDWLALLYSFRGIPPIALVGDEVESKIQGSNL
jgi:hypothetical protein